MPHFDFVLDSTRYDEAIVMRVGGVIRLNVFFLAPAGMGVTSASRDLARKVVGFLNTLPQEEAALYPFNKGA
jgi:hypothetical protein